MPQSPYLDASPTGLHSRAEDSPGPCIPVDLKEAALRQAPGVAISTLRPVPVRVRAAAGSAIAYTVTHVLVESEDDGVYEVTWQPNWLVHRM